MSWNQHQSTGKTNMDSMYVEKDFQKSSISNSSPGVCYVCGSPNSAIYQLKTKASTSEPHFPFLENHEPPLGCELPKGNGTVAVCYVCYRFLLAQWDSHERKNTPYSTRLYWLKRVDQGPYSGTDSQNPDESRHSETSPVMGTAAKLHEPIPTPVQRGGPNPLKRSRSHFEETAIQLTEESGVTHSKIERYSPAPREYAHSASDLKGDRPFKGSSRPSSTRPAVVEDSTEALDLRSSASVNRERDGDRAPSRSSVASQESNSHNDGLCPGSGVPVIEILDLSMPDKNATTEVCYVCGDEFQKGLLSHAYAKPIQHSPFFPSLMLHPRPSRSRPMDSAGRVQACEICISFLLQQWQTHQARNTPHAERHYLLRKRQTPVYDTTTFICYACGLEYPSSSLRLLYCRPNAESESYYPYLENVKPPTGSSPISPQGMVQVCAICYKSIPQRHKVFGGAAMVEATAHPTQLQGREMMRMQSPSASLIPVERPSPPTPSWPSATSELGCYVCHRPSPADAMKMLNCYPERRHLPGQRFMHFPFLKTLPTPPGPAFFDSVTNRTLVCGDCFGHFSHQWQVFENDGLALELRHYTLPASVHRVISQPMQSLALPPTNKSSDTRSPAGSPLLTAETSAAPVHQQPLLVAINEQQLRVKVTAASTSTQADLVQQQMSPNALAHQRQSLLRNQPFPLAVRSTTPNTGDRQRPPSSHSNNRTPPAPTGSTLPSPGSLSASCPATQASSTDATLHGKDGSSSSSRPTSSAVESSIYCYLCGLNSTRSFAHWLPSTPSASEPTAPYFPYVLHLKASSKAERLRDDGAALVCTFCYHMVHSQWKQYEDAPASKTLQPLTRVYNTHDYACYVCGIATYRRRVRALPVKDFPFLKQHRQPRHSLSIENGQFVVVCLDCFESLRTQSLEYERWGLPVEKRQYNWMAIPPPPEDSNNLSTPLERLLAMEEQKRANEAQKHPASAATATEAPTSSLPLVTVGGGGGTVSSSSSTTTPQLSGSGQAHQSASTPPDRSKGVALPATATTAASGEVTRTPSSHGESNGNLVDSEKNKPQTRLSPLSIVDCPVATTHCSSGGSSSSNHSTLAASVLDKP